MYYEYAYNLQQLWISIIALWVNMFTWLWISIYSVMAVHIMATHDTIMDIHKDNSNLDIQNVIMDI